VHHRLDDDAVHAWVHARALRGRLPGSARQLSGEHLVNHHAQGIDVSAMIDLAMRVDLLVHGKLRVPMIMLVMVMVTMMMMTMMMAMMMAMLVMMMMVMVVMVMILVIAMIMRNL
jgi:hypothetical protein